MNGLTLPTILIVEDEPLILLDVEVTLKDAGYISVAIGDGASGLAELEEHYPSFSALVTDIDLGKVSGWDIARRARELSPGLPIVYMSGGSSNDWQAYGVPESVMLPKPFAPAQLVTALSTLINAAVANNPKPQ